MGVGDIQAQLALLRRRVAGIERKYAGAGTAPASVKRADAAGLPGGEVETAFGRHWEMEKLYERHRRHGSFEISDLAELPAGLFGAMSKNEIGEAPPESWAFLDTETTGLAGGSGTIAFLIGVGRITPEGFRVRQFFLREHGEEASALEAVAGHLRQFRVMVTYNGKAFDQPLLETRYRMARARAPFGGLAHLDLLFGARRLWKLRLESCRLVELERRILGVEREGDVPGAMIPQLYFDSLRAGNADGLAPVFYHNALDILTLACLCGIVPRAFEDPDAIAFAHGAEMAALGRWWRQMGEPERALRLFRRAIAKGLPDELMWRTMWDAAAIEKKSGEGAKEALRELAGARNPFQGRAMEELAKICEHKERDYAKALEWTLAAIGTGWTAELAVRKERLEGKVAGRGACYHTQRGEPIESSGSTDGGRLGGDGDLRGGLPRYDYAADLGELQHEAGRGRDGGGDARRTQRHGPAERAAAGGGGRVRGGAAGGEERDAGDSSDGVRVEPVRVQDAERTGGYEGGRGGADDGERSGTGHPFKNGDDDGGSGEVGGESSGGPAHLIS